MIELRFYLKINKNILYRSNLKIIKDKEFNFKNKFKIGDVLVLEFDEI